MPADRQDCAPGLRGRDLCGNNALDDRTLSQHPPAPNAGIRLEPRAPP